MESGSLSSPAIKTGSRCPLQERFIQRKNSRENLDRFTPNRSAMDFDYAHCMLTEGAKENYPCQSLMNNFTIDVYGQLHMIKEADCFFWGMRNLGIEPNVQNVFTCNTMISIYGKLLDHEKVTDLIQEMQSRAIQSNAITYSTIISICEKAGKLDRTAVLFHKLRTSGVKIDEVLYQTMIVAYQRAGLVVHAKRLFNELEQPDNVSRETAITIFARAGKVDEAMWVFRQAFDAGVVKDISVFVCIIDIFSRDRKYAHVVEVFEKMRLVKHFPDSYVIALVLNAFGKLRGFDKADALYKQMYEKECVFPNEVHFEMLGLYGARMDFKMVESWF
ncbi:hypothetical protein TSUD_326600 [Trifolium subterraneum]|uniref:Pentacotripeptide-repeat region of PRORP domain-containing protein n=1 Tax=Trifolium subterraneum TaxID=3900 RepID=A0A2Z6LTU8_TRISU|nr:hypothetical protein TSUD_326600 [Trifolium subterraneum]